MQQAEGDQELVFLGAAIERAKQQRLDVGRGIAMGGMGGKCGLPCPVSEAR
jgi:hypothetical protein